jgi:cell shape-determining protein MreC
LLPGTFRETVAGGVRDTLLRPVIALQRGAVESDARFADPARLRSERDSLAVYLVGQATLAAENRQLRNLLGLRQRLPPAFVPAEVVRVRERGFDGAFLLTAGQEDGVRVGAPIIAASGLVGMVREVDDRLAMGIDWTHPDFRASAMTTDGETYGIVEPRTAARGEAMLALTGAAFHTDLADGTLIVTSGRGGVYPRGVPIGTVVRPEEAEAGWRKSYLLRPLVSPAEMTHVLVLGERREALGDQDLALSWGIQPPQPEPVDTGRVSAPAPRVSQPATSTPAASPAPSAPRRQGPRLLGRPVQPQAPADTAGPQAEGRR